MNRLSVAHGLNLNLYLPSHSRRQLDRAFASLLDRKSSFGYCGECVDQWRLEQALRQSGGGGGGLQEMIQRALPFVDVGNGEVIIYSFQRRGRRFRVGLGLSQFGSKPKKKDDDGTRGPTLLPGVDAGSKPYMLELRFRF